MESVSVNLDEFNLLATNVGATAGPGSSTARDWGALGAAVPEPARPLTSLTAAAVAASAEGGNGKNVVGDRRPTTARSRSTKAASTPLRWGH